MADFNVRFKNYRPFVKILKIQKLRASAILKKMAPIQDGGPKQ